MMIKSALVRWLPAGLMMVAIFIFSAIPSEEMPEFGAWDMLVKKGGHMLGYAMLAAACWRGVSGPARYRWIFAGLIAVGFAVSDEFHQSYVPGRNATWVDVLVDVAGCGLSLILISASQKIREFLLWKVV